MKRIHSNPIVRLLWLAGPIAGAFLYAHLTASAQQSVAKAAPGPVNVRAELLNAPQQAADELVNEAKKFDVRVPEKIFGQNVNEMVLPGNTHKTGNERTTSLPKHAKREAYPWIPRRVLEHSCL